MFETHTHTHTRTYTYALRTSYSCRPIPDHSSTRSTDISSLPVGKEKGKRACITHMHARTRAHGDQIPRAAKAQPLLMCSAASCYSVFCFLVETGAVRPDKKHTITKQHGRSPFSVKIWISTVGPCARYTQYTIHTHTRTHAHAHLERPTWLSQRAIHKPLATISITLLRALTSIRFHHSHLLG